ncbi:hypothetical protein DPMN_039738 [Dreissena polymorpha]|uniref:Uncharacterized protein n=1 Tax=Dreissena polymorpha TaxID=45954 RepID=A0A9D4HUB5_DREPO|nr:hypothetical protein DPMN_039738 [Dreissena polymorpha]
MAPKLRLPELSGLWLNVHVLLTLPDIILAGENVQAGHRETSYLQRHDLKEIGWGPFNAKCQFPKFSLYTYTGNYQFCPSDINKGALWLVHSLITTQILAPRIMNILKEGATSCTLLPNFRI